MLILSSPILRFFLIFYSLSILILLYHLKTQIQLLLEHNSTYWHISCYQNIPFFAPDPILSCS